MLLVFFHHFISQLLQHVCLGRVHLLAVLSALAFRLERLTLLRLKLSCLPARGFLIGLALLFRLSVPLNLLEHLELFLFADELPLSDLL